MQQEKLDNFIQIPRTGIFVRQQSIAVLSVSESNGKLSVEYGMNGSMKNALLLPADALDFLTKNITDGIGSLIKGEVLKYTQKHLDLVLSKEMQANLIEFRMSENSAFLVVSPTQTYVHEKYVLFVREILSESDDFEVEVQTWAETLKCQKQ